ncbi:undecaprenyl-diphosphate phosphatase [Micromonospora sp. NPDC000089]|uniref:undecaprenyl-diphosphate phosphatase n=1 Tax=unclassified Micromonospora TaxID=2617518 RepID=UPI0036BFAFE8
MSGGLTYPEAVVIGVLQGVTELFPVSSLGHSVILPALIGGRWARDLDVSAPESPYLAFVVGLHVATALALLVFFWRDWVRVVRGFLTSVRHRRVAGPDERLAWMIILATIPVGLAGLLLEHTFRTVLGRPVPAAVFLMLNGLLLLGAERLRRRAATAEPVGARAGDPVPVLVGSDREGTAFASAATAGPGARQADVDLASDHRLAAGSMGGAVLIGAAQILALLPGISRSGATMAAGLLRGFGHEDAARFSFLLATPVILAAGVLKLPDLFGDLGAGIRGQVLAGSLAAGLSAYAAVRFLTRWFETRTLTPFAVYCLLAGLVSLVWLGVA